MLRAKINGCQALIHLVGLRYGMEPDPASLPTGASRRSFTQMEYHLGRQLQNERGDGRFRVYTFVCPEDFPYDTGSAPESDECRDLQRAHRQAIFGGAHLYEQPKNPAELRTRIHALQEQVLALENERLEVIRQVQGVQLTAEQGFALALKEISRLNHRLDASEAHNQKMFALLLEMNDRVMSAQIMQPQLGTTQAVQLALQTGTLTTSVPASEAAVQLESVIHWVDVSVNCGPLERSMAATLQGRFDKAAEYAGDAYFQEKQQPEPRFWFLIRAALLEANALVQDQRLDEACDALRETTSLLDARVQPLLCAHLLQELGNILEKAGRYVEAEQALHGALTLLTKHLGPLCAPVAEVADKLGAVLSLEGRYQETEPFFRWAVSWAESSEGESSIFLSTCLDHLAGLLEITNRKAEAEMLYRRALVIDERNCAPEYLRIAASINNLAVLLHNEGRLAEAEPMYRRVVTIYEKSYGPMHPNVATGLGNLAKLLKATSRQSEAEPLYRRALAIDEQNYGGHHPNVALRLWGLASFLHQLGRSHEGLPLIRRAVNIYLRNGQQQGYVHPSLEDAQQCLKEVEQAEEGRV